MTWRRWSWLSNWLSCLSIFQGVLGPIKALDRKLLRDLLKMRGQIIAIVLIVACGVGVLVTMMSAYSSLKLSQETYYERYRFADVFVQLKRAPLSLVAEVEAIPGVQTVRDRVVVEVTADVPNLPEPATVRLVSIPDGPAQPEGMLNGLFIRSGRYSQRADEVLASEVFLKANALAIGDRIGAVINGRWQSLRIVGVALSPEYIYEIRGTDLMPDNKRFGVLWISRQALATAFDLKGAFNDLSLTLLPQSQPHSQTPTSISQEALDSQQAEVIFQLDHLLEPYGGLGAFSREDQISHRFISEEIRQLSAQAVLLPSIFLGIAAFLLNLLLARLVSTQRDQIAVMKAFGYSNGAVGVHYFKLVMLVVAAGAILGLGLGIWLGGNLTRLYADFYHFPVLRFELSGQVLLVACLVSAGAATLGAILSVRRAVALPPAEAMRPEPPATYRPTLVEKMGLQRLVSPANRIILRNLERRPWQAGFSIFGIAIAVAILVLGRYFQDAMDAIVEVQFRTIQREDATLVFNQPLSAQAQFDLYSLPGVMRAEPFRIVPARLRYEHRDRLSGVTGLTPTGELRQLLDRQLKPVSLPPEGILLSQKLAEILQVQPGQLLTLEILEGARPTRQVPVSGIFDELVGLSAYMDMGALNQLMQEDTTLSGAYLMVDSQQQAKLYQQLKQTPAIAGVSLRETIIRQFEEIIGKSMGGFNQVLVGFASVIAFGVVYNATRIALSERSRELATLRIIGFTRGEIAFILLGEQFFLLCLAIPLGFAIGFGLVYWLTQIYNWELFRFPLVVSPASYAFAFTVIMASAVVSGEIIRRQLSRLDLVAVLKTRE